MKLQSLTISYMMQRSCSFQNVKVEASVVCEMEPGDKLEVVYAAGMKRLVAMVEPEVEAGIQEACRLAHNGG